MSWHTGFRRSSNVKRYIPVTKRLVRTSLLLILSFGLGLSSTETARCSKNGHYPDYHGVNGTQAIITGMDLLYNWRSEEAERRFEQLIRESPDKPSGYFYHAMVTWSRLASGFWSPETVREFIERVDRTIDVANSRIEQDSGEPQDFFYLGGALGFKGRLELMRENWVSSFFLAADAVYALKACLKMDPHNKDVLFGLGVFDYYTARLSGVAKFLTHLLVHRGDKEEGLRKLHSAAREARYSATEAKSMLLHIYLFLEEDHAQARHIAEELDTRYDRNLRYKTLKGVSYIRLGMDRQLRETIHELRHGSPEEPPSNKGSPGENRALYLESIYNLYHGEYKEARSKLRLILSRSDVETDPSMNAWPIIKIGMSYDMEGNRDEATRYYKQVLTLKNGSGAQFLAKRYLDKPLIKGDPFIGY